MQSDAVTMSAKRFSMCKSLTLEGVKGLFDTSIANELIFPPFPSDSDPLVINWIITLDRHQVSDSEAGFLYLKIGVQRFTNQTTEIGLIDVAVKNSIDTSVVFERIEKRDKTVVKYGWDFPNLCVGHKTQKTVLALFRHQYSTLAKDLKLDIRTDYVNGHSVVSVPKRIALDADPELKSDLLSLLESESDADVEFVVDGERIRAHKIILSARSQHFRAMFHSGMKESDGAPITITDASASSIKGMLRFIYGGVLPDQSTPGVPYLFVVADKYGLDLLKDSCGDILSERLSRANVCDSLVLADASACPRLKDGCIRFIKGNLKEVMKSEKWREIRKNADLFGTVMDAVHA